MRFVKDSSSITGIFAMLFILGVSVVIIHNGPPTDEIQIVKDEVQIGKSAVKGMEDTWHRLLISFGNV
jgi:hypothetical protein